MSQEWMIDVLSDLQKFARSNGMMRVEEQIGHTIELAKTDIHAWEGQVEASEIPHVTIASSVSGTYRRC